MEIRVFVEADTDAVVDLWNLTDLTHPNNDPSLDIKRKMNDSPWGFLVAMDGKTIIGSIMVGYDGHRGWINYLACHPNHRRHGVAKSLMNEAKKLLIERGCPKINLQVRSGNESAVKFYESIGYLDDNVTSFGLRLNPDN
ncbi:MAG: GNAT family acetyltransferase [Actinobacteria bacterium]|nr:GNAT family acetyltransferase [Actinomycetota bacterium]